MYYLVRPFLTLLGCGGVVEAEDDTEPVEEDCESLEINGNGTSLSDLKSNRYTHTHTHIWFLIVYDRYVNLLGTDSLLIRYIYRYI